MSLLLSKGEVLYWATYHIITFTFTFTLFIKEFSKAYTFLCICLCYLGANVNVKDKCGCSFLHLAILQPKGLRNIPEEVLQVSSINGFLCDTPNALTIMIRIELPLHPWAVCLETSCMYSRPVGEVPYTRAQSNHSLKYSKLYLKEQWWLQKESDRKVNIRYPGLPLNSNIITLHHYFYNVCGGISKCSLGRSYVICVIFMLHNYSKAFAYVLCLIPTLL